MLRCIDSSPLQDALKAPPSVMTHRQARRGCQKTKGAKTHRLAHKMRLGGVVIHLEQAPKAARWLPHGMSLHKPAPHPPRRMYTTPRTSLGPTELRLVEIRQSSILRLQVCIQLPLSYTSRIVPNHSSPARKREVVSWNGIPSRPPVLSRRRGVVPIRIRSTAAVQICCPQHSA
jgi:hypothetical protein